MADGPAVRVPPGRVPAQGAGQGRHEAQADSPQPEKSVVEYRSYQVGFPWSKDINIFNIARQTTNP